MEIGADYHGYISALLIFLQIIYSGSEQLSETEVREFDQFVKQTLKCRKLPAVAVSMVRDGEAVFSRGYGHADIAAGLKAGEHTKFCIGSLTKAFTTTILAGILSQREDITWDTPIRDILGDWFQLSDKLRTDNVNLRDLLAHKVGTPQYFHLLLAGYPANTTRHEFVRRLRYMPATKEFRTEFQYSNYMYTLAGYVAEVLVGESWENMVADRLLHKLGMRSTGFVDQLESLDDIAAPYVLKDGKLVAVNRQLALTVSPSGPAGSIYTTASDMTKWMLFHLGGLSRPGPYHQTLVPPKFQHETYRSQMIQEQNERTMRKPEYPVSDVTVSYNMGWVTSVYRGYGKLWHSGGIATYTSQLWLLPDRNAGIFVVSSGPTSEQGSTHSIRTIVSRAADMLLGEEPWLNQTTACTYPRPWRQGYHEEDGPTTSHSHTWSTTRPQSDYIGVFGHRGFGNITIFIGTSENGTNELHLLFGRFGELIIYPNGGETDFLGYYIGYLWYITGSDNPMKPFVIKFILSSDQKEITGLRFPVDFHEPEKTLFVKDLDYTSTVLATDVNTSYSCHYLSGTGVTCYVSACTRLLFSAILYLFIQLV